MGSSSLSSLTEVRKGSGNSETAEGKIREIKIIFIVLPKQRPLYLRKGAKKGVLSTRILKLMELI